MKPLLLFILLSLPISIHAQTADVLPVRVSEGAQSLNGAWKFKYFPALNAAGDENFFQPSFDVAAWKTIAVPSHWELQGFAEPQYGDDVKEGTGLYRDVTLFALPQLHLEDYTARTILKADGTADLQLDFKATAVAARHQLARTADRMVRGARQKSCDQKGVLSQLRPVKFHLRHYRSDNHKRAPSRS